MSDGERSKDAGVSVRCIEVSPFSLASSYLTSPCLVSPRLTSPRLASGITKTGILITVIQRRLAVTDQGLVFKVFAAAS